MSAPISFEPKLGPLKVSFTVKNTFINTIEGEPEDVLLFGATKSSPVTSYGRLSDDVDEYEYEPLGLSLKNASQTSWPVCSPGVGRMAAPFANHEPVKVSVSVKNTFIDTIDGDTEDTPLFGATKSCPGTSYRRLSDDGDEYDSEPLGLPLKISLRRPSVTWSSDDESSSVDDVAIVVCPLLPSRGSALHAAGMCKPCGWFWKPGSCSNGYECNHCHACPADALRARKKARQEALRMLANVSKSTIETVD